MPSSPAEFSFDSNLYMNVEYISPIITKAITKFSIDRRFTSYIPNNANIIIMLNILVRIKIDFIIL